MKEARAAWFERFGGVRLDQLVFLDEFGATTDMARRYARGPRAAGRAGGVQDAARPLEGAEHHRGHDGER